MKLSELTKGKTAVVDQVTLEAEQGTMARRLFLMGFRKGTRVEMMGSAPLGDPLVIRVKNQGYGLRKELTERIEVSLCD
jgi:ferrous iron transport protein A